MRGPGQGQRRTQSPNTLIPLTLKDFYGRKNNRGGRREGGREQA